jgi:hypothetical protein
MLQSGHDNAN